MPLPAELSRLTDRQRRVAAAYAFDGKTEAQIAFEMKVSQPTVSRHLKAARKRLGAYAAALSRPGQQRVKIRPISFSFVENV